MLVIRCYQECQHTANIWMTTGNHYHASTKIIHTCSVNHTGALEWLPLIQRTTLRRTQSTSSAGQDAPKPAINSCQAGEWRPEETPMTSMIDLLMFFSRDSRSRDTCHTLYRLNNIMQHLHIGCAHCQGYLSKNMPEHMRWCVVCLASHKWSCSESLIKGCD